MQSCSDNRQRGHREQRDDLLHLLGPLRLGASSDEAALIYILVFGIPSGVATPLFQLQLELGVDMLRLDPNRASLAGRVLCC
jgi:hypothetical protein